MDATLYTGNGTGARTVTNQYGFKPDLVWLKDRTSAYSHQLNDSVRGATAGCVYSDLTNGQDANFPLTSFNTNGFTLGNTASLISQSYVSQNGSGDNYVAWQWQAGQGSNTTNTTGTITSTVSANTTAGFSIVKYTGNGSTSATIGHGLGVAPAMVVGFALSSFTNANQHPVYHQSLPAGYGNWLQLNNAAVALSGTGQGGWGTPNSSVLTLTAGSGSVAMVNESGTPFVAYCWAEVAGFSKFGSYTGNGSTDGPFVYLGFRPKFIMFKNSATGNYWRIMDTSVNTYNVTSYGVYPNDAAAEGTATNWYVDYLSNGFKIRASTSELNGSGNTIIYAAFAENPFKYANAR